MRYILGGSLRRSEQRLRIAVELIDAASESVLWSDRFKVELEELFDLQEEIAGAVAARLSIQIDFAERRQESPLSARHARLWASAARPASDFQVQQGGELACAPAVRGGDRICARVQPRAQRALPNA